jgi:hydrogenase maturation protease
MSGTQVDVVARAVLYEGYVLYPYRPCVKTRQRWTFGGTFPEAYAAAHPGVDAGMMQTQCLLQGPGEARLSVTLRFLHLMERAVEDGEGRAVKELRVGEQTYQSWQEAVERELCMEALRVEALAGAAVRQAFSFPASRAAETLSESGRPVGRLLREQRELRGEVEVAARRVEGHLWELTCRVHNRTVLDEETNRDAAMLSAFASTHVILRAAGGTFVSMTDPPADAALAAGRCENMGCWPVLVGAADQRDTVLASPIILPDHPQIAPESPGDLFDGCEIDEILTLRILTLTEEEKRQAAAVDPRVSALMERTESLAREQLMNLHGALRNVAPVVEEAGHGR